MNDKAKKSLSSRMSTSVVPEEPAEVQLMPFGEMWKLCESSVQTVKLILADSSRTPHYLPNMSAAKSKSKSKAQEEREQKRIAFLCEREYRGQTLSPRKKLHALIPIKSSPRSKQEREVEAKFLAPLRNDKEKLNRLMIKTALIKKEKYKNSLENRKKLREMQLRYFQTAIEKSGKKISAATEGAPSISVAVAAAAVSGDEVDGARCEKAGGEDAEREEEGEGEDGSEPGSAEGESEGSRDQEPLKPSAMIRALTAGRQQAAGPLSRSHSPSAPSSAPPSISAPMQRDASSDRDQRDKRDRAVSPVLALSVRSAAGRRERVHSSSSGEGESGGKRAVEGGSEEWYESREKRECGEERFAQQDRLQQQQHQQPHKQYQQQEQWQSEDLYDSYDEFMADKQRLEEEDRELRRELAALSLDPFAEGEEQGGKDYPRPAERTESADRSHSPRSPRSEWQSKPKSRPKPRSMEDIVWYSPIDKDLRRQSIMLRRAEVASRKKEMKEKERRDTISAATMWRLKIFGRSRGGFEGLGALMQSNSSADGDAEDTSLMAARSTRRSRESTLGLSTVAEGGVVVPEALEQQVTALSLSLESQAGAGPRLSIHPRGNVPMHQLPVEEQEQIDALNMLTAPYSPRAADGVGSIGGTSLSPRAPSFGSPRAGMRSPRGGGAFKGRSSVIAPTTTRVLADATQVKQGTWITIVRALEKLAVIEHIVAGIREVKQKNVLKWKAAVVVQKCWRRYLYYHRHRQGSGGAGAGAGPLHKKKSALQKLRDKMGSNGKIRLYSQRVEACAVITTFLRDMAKGMKATMLNYFSMLKALQRRARVHQQVNNARVELLSLLFDAVFPLLSLHVKLVTSNRGSDLKNLTTYDVQKIDEKSALSSIQRLAREMQKALPITTSFHAFLRRELGRLHEVKTYFSEYANASRIDPVVKRAVLQEFLYKKRRDHVNRLRRAQQIKFVIPPIVADEARVFIEGGSDPLAAHLRAIELKQEQMHQEYQEQLRRKRDRSYKMPKVLVGDAVLPLLLNITAEEVAETFIEMAERSKERREMLQAQQEEQQHLDQLADLITASADALDAAAAAGADAGSGLGMGGGKGGAGGGGIDLRGPLHSGSHGSGSGGGSQHTQNSGHQQGHAKLSGLARVQHIAVDSEEDVFDVGNMRDRGISLGGARTPNRPPAALVRRSSVSLLRKRNSVMVPSPHTQQHYQPTETPSINDRRRTSMAVRR